MYWYFDHPKYLDSSNTLYYRILTKLLLISQIKFEVCMSYTVREIWHKKHYMNSMPYMIIAVLKIKKFWLLFQYTKTSIIRTRIILILDNSTGFRPGSKFSINFHNSN